MLGQQRAEVEGRVEHGEVPVRVQRPLLARPVAVELDAVVVRIAQVDGLADSVVGRALQRDAGLEEPP